jgi:hypothetical protein
MVFGKFFYGLHSPTSRATPYAYVELLSKPWLTTPPGVRDRVQQHMGVAKDYGIHALYRIPIKETSKLG